MTGVYGVSFLVAWAAATAVLLWERGLPPRPARLAGITTSRAAWGGLAPTFREFDSPEELVAADPDRMRAEFAVVNDELLANTEREAAAGARIVVWPESAAFTLEADEEGLAADIREVAQRHGVYVNAGMSVHTGTHRTSAT